MNATTEVLEELRRVMVERDEARAEVERLREMAHDFEAMREDRAKAWQERDKLADRIERLCGELESIAAAIYFDWHGELGSLPNEVRAHLGRAGNAYMTWELRALRTERNRDELLDTIDAIITALGIDDAQHAIDAIETLKKERDEARDGKLREIRHDWTAMLEDRAQAWRERDEAREELAGLRAEVDALTESLRACVAERDGWQRTARQRSDEIEMLEEKLHADTVTRIAVTRAWREAVAEVAEVLARTAAEKGGRP